MSALTLQNKFPCFSAPPFPLVCFSQGPIWYTHKEADCAVDFRQGNKIMEIPCLQNWNPLLSQKICLPKKRNSQHDGIIFLELFVWKWALCFKTGTIFCSVLQIICPQYRPNSILLVIKLNTTPGDQISISGIKLGPLDIFLLQGFSVTTYLICIIVMQTSYGNAPPKNPKKWQFSRAVAMRSPWKVVSQKMYARKMAISEKWWYAGKVGNAKFENLDQEQGWNNCHKKVWQRGLRKT